MNEKTGVDAVRQTVGNLYQDLHRQIDGVPGTALLMKDVSLFIDSASYCGTTTDGSYQNAPLCPYANDPCKGHYKNEYVSAAPFELCPPSPSPAFMTPAKQLSPLLSMYFSLCFSLKAICACFGVPRRPVHLATGKGGTESRLHLAPVAWKQA